MTKSIALPGLRSRILLVFIGSLLAMGARAADWQYTVRPGDTLWSVCHEYTSYSNCWRELGEYNGITRPRALSIGERLKIPAGWLKQVPVAARASYIQGQVLIGKEGEQQPLTANQALNIGDRVVTREGSATLQFSDGSLLTMMQHSEIVIDAVSAFRQSRATTIEVSLPAGAVRITVPERTPRTRFNVRTPSAVAAVRGTQFRVASEEGSSTRSEVLEGTVALAAAGEGVDINAGFGARAESGKPVAPPVQLLAAPEWNLSCTDPGYAEWESLPDAQYYRLTLLEDDVSTDRVISVATLRKNNITFRDLEEKCYQLRVSAVDGAGFNGMESQRQFCYELALEPPVWLSTAWVDDSLRLSWQAVPFAESYVVEVSRSATFDTLLMSETVDADQTQLTLERFPENAHVRLRATAGEHSSESSESRELEHESQNGWLVGILAAIVAFAVL